MIYVHIPFCKSFCTYCDFYSEICAPKVQKLFVDELCREIEDRRAEIESTLGLNTLYFGGGTPSVLEPELLKRIVDTLGYGPYEEFTVEVNPDDVTPEYAGFLKGIGVNRVSMGVQSFNDALLRWMNRRHDSAGAVAAFRILRQAGFDNISIDLIFGVSSLRQEVWEDTVKKAIELAPEHISAYQLTIEEGSDLERMIKEGRYREASDEQCAAQYESLCSLLRSAGFNHYEISNFAFPGKEAIHNQAYWRRLPYVGLGPGAHSLIGEDTRSWNTSQISGWTREYEHLTPEQIREERLMLGLRTDAGVDGMRIPESDWFISDSIIEDLI
ncbi:MAG: radical SAM family heme chaperone HemW [Bacteroidales bacterium]|nr:radical SAM family heme chaperone HemW [Bacteroidales bacterium]